MNEFIVASIGHDDDDPGVWELCFSEDEARQIFHAHLADGAATVWRAKVEEVKTYLSGELAIQRRARRRAKTYEATDIQLSVMLGGRALRRFIDDAGCDLLMGPNHPDQLKTGMSDLLIDLMHYCDAFGLDWDWIANEAARYHDEECLDAAFAAATGT